MNDRRIGIGPARHQPVHCSHGVPTTEFFVLLAQELQFGRAAELLHIGQPGLSQQIRRLEREVGTSLFDRTSRRVVLTPTGELFLVEARRLLEQAERALDVGRSGATGQMGRCASTSPTVSTKSTYGRC